MNKEARFSTQTMSEVFFTNKEAGGRVHGQGDSSEGLPFVNLPPWGRGCPLLPVTAAGGCGLSAVRQKNGALGGIRLDNVLISKRMSPILTIFLYKLHKSGLFGKCSIISPNGSMNYSVTCPEWSPVIFAEWFGELFGELLRRW